MITNRVVSNPYYGVRRSPFKRQYFEQKFSDQDRFGQLQLQLVKLQEIHYTLETKLTDILLDLDAILYQIQNNVINKLQSIYENTIYIDPDEEPNTVAYSAWKTERRLVSEPEGLDTADILQDCKASLAEIEADVQATKNTIQNRLGTLSNPQPVRIIP